MDCCKSFLTLRPYLVVGESPELVQTITEELTGLAKWEAKLEQESRRGEGSGEDYLLNSNVPPEVLAARKHEQAQAFREYMSTMSTEDTAGNTSGRSSVKSNVMTQ